MSVVCIEGINQSGKSSVVNDLFRHLGEKRIPTFHLKLPFYQTPYGIYILNQFLPSIDSRPNILRKSVIAQMALFALNRLETLFIIQQLQKEGRITPQHVILMDRTPYSNFFTFIDALLDGLRTGDIELMQEHGEISEAAIVAIRVLVQGLEDRISNYTGRIRLEAYHAQAIAHLYQEAKKIIENLEAHFLEELMGEQCKILILDLPAEIAFRIHAKTGKLLDAQEGLLVQTIVRHMYLALAREPSREESVAIIEQVPTLQGQRLSLEAVLTMTINLAGLESHSSSKERSVSLSQLPDSWTPCISHEALFAGLGLVCQEHCHTILKKLPVGYELPRQAPENGF